MNETVDLFGNKTLDIVPKQKRNKTLFEDYDGFVEKFKPKKTTDDCYTPPEVYDCVLKYVAGKFDISGYEIIRPFYPGGDYENISYSPRCIVVDNPPFSIISKIARFYIERGIKFFLFAPHLTLFSSNQDCTAIVCGADITYENGAKVKTSFLSNMFGDIRIMGDPVLYNDLDSINASQKVNLPKYQYPLNVLTVSMVTKYVENGMSIQFDKKEVYYCRGLDVQKKYKKSLFGNGFLLSEKAATEKAATEKDDTIIWELSDREWDIIKSLSVSK